jgi:hypothetical protein
MPEAATSPTTASTDLQPSLLDERRDWMRHDREAKLDIFLSLTEDVMQEVLEVGPPLPPTNLSAQEMLQALDERFAVFKFEAYHHAFCHFLNLHIDQYPSFAEFNQEFSSTLEDLLDHGHPLSNVQACSAYFSKLRCTQNPWVAKKLAEWDAQEKEVHYSDLLQESPPWSFIRPLATKTSQNFQVESIPEEHLEDTSGSDSDTPSETSESSTTSSISSHSRQALKPALDITPPQGVEPQKQKSIDAVQSQEITILASSEEIIESKPQAPPTEPEPRAGPAVPERGSSKNKVPSAALIDITDSPDAQLPEWLASKKSIARPLNQAFLERPLPPLPTQSSQAKDDERSASSLSKTTTTTDPSPRSASSLSKTTTERSPSSLSNATFQRTHTKKPSSSSLRPSTPALQLETTHPTLRPADLHPALRPPLSTRTTAESIPTLQRPNISRRPSTSSPNLAVPWPCTPDLTPRPQSSRANFPFAQGLNIVGAPEDRKPADETDPDDADVDLDDMDLDSDWSLPLQGTRDSAWAYLYESKGGYLINPPPLPHSISPISSTSPLLPHATRNRTPTFEDTVLSRGTSPHLSLSHKRSESLLTQMRNRTPTPTFEPRSESQTRNRTPTFDDTRSPAGHKKSSSLDFMTRLSGDSLLESSEEVRERARNNKKKSWGSLGVGVNAAMARFSKGQGIREII